MADYWDNAVVEPEGLDRQAQAESGGDPTAVSPKGARGLFQIMPATAKDYGVDQSKLDDPGISRYIAARRMSELTDRYKGDRRLALAAYNWGPAHIDKVGGDESKWPKETRDYVKKNMGGDAASAAAPTGDYWAQAKVADPLAPERSLSPEASAKRMEEVEGPVTSSYDPLVENVTIGAVTGGLGVPAGFGFIPKTVGGKLLTMAEGTAEQYLYGWASEKAQQVVTEQVGPKTGLAAGIVAPLMLGGVQGAVGRMGGIPAAQAGAAREAATVAETMAYEKAPEQLYEYGEDIAAANKQYARKAAETTLEVAEEQAPQQAAGKLGEFLGRTPEETAATKSMEPEDFALHRANMRNATFGGPNRISQALGSQFEAATAGKLNDPGEIAPVAKSVASEREWLDTHNLPLAKPVEDLINSMPVAETDSELKAKIPDLLRGKADKESQARFTQYYDEWTKAHPDQAIDKEARDAIAIRALGGQGTEKPTIGQLLGWRSQASKLVATMRDHNQHVAMELRDALDQSLLDSGLQIPQGLREQWATYKSQFNPSFRRSVATAANPVRYGKALFSDDPQRTLQVIRNATDDEKNSLRQLFADYVHTQGMDPLKMGKKVSPSVLKSLFGETPYQNIKPWLETDPKALAWEQFQKGVPTSAVLSSKGFQDEMQTISAERAAAVRQAGIKLARKLGPAGRGKLAKILSTRDPEAAAKIVEQEFPITPEGAQALYAQAQQVPAKRAFEQAREARQIERGLDINAVRENAAVAALMKDPKSIVMNNLKRRLYAWHLPMLLAGGLAGGGVGSHYQLGISGMIVGMMAAEKFRNMLRPALTDPEAAREYWRAIEMTPSTLNARKFGARMARIATAVASRRLGGPALDEQEDQDTAEATP